MISYLHVAAHLLPDHVMSNKYITFCIEGMEM